MRSPLGSASSGSSSRSGARTKSRRGHLGVRQRETLVLQLDVAEEQHVHVDRAGAVPRAGEDAAELDLYRLADVEEVEWLEARWRCARRRSGSPAGRGSRRPARSRRATRPPRRSRRGLPSSSSASRDVLGPLADVRAEPEVAGPRRQSSSSSGGSSSRSTSTSTDTSSIASGSGGSGLVALTRTLSER